MKSNFCVTCGTEIPEGDHVCKYCASGGIIPQCSGKLISTWKELSKVPPSKTHRLEIDLNGCSGWIMALNEEFSYERCHYLSTHTFYEKNYKQSTALLRKCGFDVYLKNWG